MHPFASGSSIVTLSRHPSGGAGPSGLGGGPGKCKRGDLFFIELIFFQYFTCSRHRNLQNIRIRIVQLSKKNGFDFFI